MCVFVYSHEYICGGQKLIMPLPQLFSTLGQGLHSTGAHQLTSSKPQDPPVSIHVGLIKGVHDCTHLCLNF